jgi:hypothetical protein
MRKSRATKTFLNKNINLNKRIDKKKSGKDLVIKIQKENIQDRSDQKMKIRQKMNKIRKIIRTLTHNSQKSKYLFNLY